MNELARLDHEAFEAINGSLSNSFFDAIMPTLTDLHRSEVAVGLFTLIMIAWIYRVRKKAWPVLLGLALSVLLSETISYRLVKHYVSRPRPEFTEGVNVNLRTHSHSGKSFPSLHASNNFAAATFLSTAYSRAAPVFFLIAFIVGMSRVYVGVHFPADVIGGAIIGILCGLIVRFVLKRSKVT
ncbi:MAG TPA: phosphatase PAP2 family protein [Bdellovibrionales bacterium]|nr:phosphatase PAP2 family protein [Bdellovibrionales bacterium]